MHAKALILHAGDYFYRQGFPEAAQEILDDSTDDVDVTDLVHLGVECEGDDREVP